VDFFQIGTKEAKGGVIEVFPDFTVGRSKDLMVRGRSFYAIWDEERGLWSTDEYDVQRLVDDELAAYAEKLKRDGFLCTVKYLRSFGSNSWSQFQNFLSKLSDSHVQLDQNLTFSNSEVTKSDYVSRRLSYPLEPGEHNAWDELVGTLYSVEERTKIEWAIGAVISGDSKKIQKFLVLYGPAGTGKSTVLDIIQKLFQGYTTTFEAKALGSSNNNFSTEAFKHNPLVAIQHDGDLSRIDDNTKLNSIVSHEEMTMNEKYKPSYSARVNSFLFMGTNQPVKISDAKSGIIRRLIDVHPTGVRIPVDHYHALMARIDFELGAIAHHCLEVYRKLGKNYYNAYRPLEMMLQTDVFFNFIEANYDIFKQQNGTTLKQAYLLYKEFCSETGIERVLPQYKVREELRNYFDEFKDRAEVDGVVVRSYYSGFTAHPFKQQKKNGVVTYSLVMDETTSLFNLEYADCAAQYAKDDGTPKQRWLNVKTSLKELDPTKLHYVKVPENHIVIDFDLKDQSGEKSLERNLEAASRWPATYAEFSKSGKGVHLHYIYDGDVNTLSRSLF
jgi:energy-coupling factor transporter ATP-binding protein EcfA2